ncbi:hypothetical protein ETC05_16530 [Geobacillus sp. BMUD]|uniref:hypothetical protein n=1 Tax=Geobacillus sp. BMUD TaxID=2508876 RepID=UPI001491D4FA|nr:hypothetical protein [Geobacillus sp. BMUD]NNU85345.1 hypothetical protein [Geobacillus sp. BMUD]
MPLTEKEQRFLRQTSEITKSGGKLTPAQQQTLKSIQDKQAKEERFIRQYNEIKQSGGTTSAAQDSTYKLLTGSAYKPPAPQPTVNPYLQSEIDKANRFMRQYSQLPNPTSAQQSTYQRLMNTYGANAWKDGRLTITDLDPKAERAYRAANPYADYTKEKEMRFLRQIDDMLLNNQGVSDAQLQQYNTLANKWNFDPTKSRITKEVEKEIQAEIEAKKKAIQDQLALEQQANELAIQQNNAYLAEQLKKLQEQKAVNDQQAQMLANRRGGFYSGGLDYQLGQNITSYNQATEALQRDIAARNADIYNRNALLAQQAAEQIKMLEQQAPTLIQQRIREELDRQRGIQMQEAQLTGMYNGQPTLAYQQFQASRDDEMRRRAEWESEQKWNRLIQSAGLTGVFQGKPTLQALEFELQKRVQLGQLSLAQAAQILDQAKFEWEKEFNQKQFDADQYWKQQDYNLEQQRLDLAKQEIELKKMPEPTDLKKYTDQLNKIYLRKTDNGSYKVTNPQALFDAIVGLGLSDSDTDKLVNMYGLQKYKEQLMKNFQGK